MPFIRVVHDLQWKQVCRSLGILCLNRCPLGKILNLRGHVLRLVGNDNGRLKRRSQYIPFAVFNDGGICINAKARIRNPDAPAFFHPVPVKPCDAVQIYGGDGIGDNGFLQLPQNGQPFLVEKIRV